MEIVSFFQRWIGWGWGLAFLIWVLGAIVILTSVQRYFLERTGSRRLTIVIFIVWGLIVMGAASRFFGFGPPSGP
jgi:predicted membrane channel-forming protein YqfA (hemolysin III family)